MLSPARDEYTRVTRLGRDNGPRGRSRVSFVVDVRVGEHGCAPPIKQAANGGIRLRQYRDDTAPVVLVWIALKVEAGAAKGLTHTFQVDGARHSCVPDPQVPAG